MSITVEPAEAKPAASRPAQGALGRLVLRLHFYVGILVGPFLLVAAISGGIYAVAPSIESLIYKDQLKAVSTAQNVSLKDQVNTARGIYPNLKLGSVLVGKPGDTTKVTFSDESLPSSSYQRAVFIDPSTGEVRGENVVYGSTQAMPFRAWLAQLHTNLNLGETGRLYSELAASWLTPVALGGLYLWWKRTRRGGSFFRVQKGAKGRAKERNRHAVLGVWMLVGIFFLSATGLTWSTYAGKNVSELRTAMNWKTPKLSAGASSVAGGAPAAAGGHEGHGGGHSSMAGMEANPATGVDTAATVALAAGLSAPLKMTPPAAEGAPWLVSEGRRSWDLGPDNVSVDTATEQVVQRINFSDYPLAAKLTDWGIRAHMGFLFGLLNQILLAAVALALAAITIHGYRMWWMRRPTRGEAKLGRPPVRGALVDLARTRPVATLIGAVLVIAVGWAVPLLGISLAAFLLIDTLVGLMARAKNARTSNDKEGELDSPSEFEPSR